MEVEIKKSVKCKMIQIYERYDGATNWKLNNAELFLKLFYMYIQSKEVANKMYCEETREHEKWQSEISPE